MDQLSIDPLSVITTYLEPTEILALSHTCGYMRNVLSSEHIWSECLNRKKPIKANAIRAQILDNCPEFVIIACGYANRLHDYSDEIGENANQRGYNLVCIEGRGWGNDDVDKVIDEETYPVYKSLNLHKNSSVVLRMRGPCRKYRDGTCRCATDAKWFTKYNLTHYHHCACFDESYKTTRGCRNGVHYMIIHYDTESG